MKKTKLLAPILTIASLGATIAPLMSLTSCGDKETITLELVKGEHVTKLETVGEVKIGKQFLIECSFEDGWRKIDPANTSIEVDGKKLEQGEDKDYHIGNSYQITVHSNAIKSQKAKVTVNAAPTMINYSYSWQSTTQQQLVTIDDGETLLGTPGVKLTPENLSVKINKGDGTTKIIATPAANPSEPKPDEYLISYNEKDITSEFAKNGFLLTDSMVAPNDQLPLNIYVVNEWGGKGELIKAYCGKAPTTWTVKAESTTIQTHGETTITLTTGDVGEYSDCKIEFIGDNLGCIVDFESNNVWKLIPDEETGTVQIKFTSLYDSTKTSTVSVTINGGE